MLYLVYDGIKRHINGYHGHLGDYVVRLQSRDVHSRLDIIQHFGSYYSARPRPVK